MLKEEKGMCESYGEGNDSDIGREKKKIRYNEVVK